MLFSHLCILGELLVQNLLFLSGLIVVLGFLYTFQVQVLSVCGLQMLSLALLLVFSFS